MACDHVCAEGEEEELFFDCREDLSAASDSYPGTVLEHNVDSSEIFPNWGSSGFRSNSWCDKLDSIRERRRKFRRCMGFGSASSSEPSSSESKGFREDVDFSVDIDRIMLDSEAVLMNSEPEIGSSMSSESNKCFRHLGNSMISDEHSQSKSGNVDDGLVPRRLGVADFAQTLIDDESQRSLRSSHELQPFMQREYSTSTTASSNSCSVRTLRKRKISWLKRLGIAACVVDRQEEEGDIASSTSNKSVSMKASRVRVRQYRKRIKEFSAVYMGQDIKAHEGAICTMKFSPDGQYLASGGEDGIVRVWHVTECELISERDIPKEEPSCIYFFANHNLELFPVLVNKEKRAKSQATNRASESACVVIPPKVFRISEKPLHEFPGHSADILDLSWSTNKYLLSSSEDKTVRLWQVGCDKCIKSFPHNDYVTCVHFNPIDENYFISGCLDGKVRIWDVSGCCVVDWADARDIVTAVRYRPDGKQVVVGSMGGTCNFYCLSDDHLQLDAQVSIEGKKKHPLKRITGFQFSPIDPQQLMVTSSDSQVQILDGTDIIRKYKGLRNANSQIYASFTSDGKHIISASEDSSVFIWNHDENVPKSKRVKSTRSREQLFSSNVSVAIPWHGLDSRNVCSVVSEVYTSQNEVSREPTIDSQFHSHGHFDLPSKPSGKFNISQRFSGYEILPKGSLTWPEEKLPSCLMATPPLSKSGYKFLRNSCQNAVISPHAWGQVIVTASWDGRIRSFCNYGLPVRF